MPLTRTAIIIISTAVVGIVIVSVFLGIALTNTTSDSLSLSAPDLIETAEPVAVEAVEPEDLSPPLTLTHTEPEPEPEPKPEQESKTMIVSVNEVSLSSAAGVAWSCRDHNTEKTVFILGSCRVAHYATYILHHDFFNDCRLVVVTVHTTPSAIYNDLDAVKLLVPPNITYFFHEFMIRFGYLNTSKKSRLNIFQLPNMADKTSVMLPNMPDPLLRVRDIMKCDAESQRLFQAYLKRGGGKGGDGGEERGCSCTEDQDCECRRELATRMIRCRDARLLKWVNIVQKVGLVTTAEVLRTKLCEMHLFNTCNHPSNLFALLVFKEMLLNEFKIDGPLPNLVMEVAQGPEIIGPCDASSWTKWDCDILEYGKWLREIFPNCELSSVMSQG